MSIPKNPSEPQTPKAQSAKEKALAEALRQNLLKRKQQARSRDAQPTTSPTTTKEEK